MSSRETLRAVMFPQGYDQVIRVQASAVGCGPFFRSSFFPRIASHLSSTLPEIGSVPQSHSLKLSENAPLDSETGYHPGGSGWNGLSQTGRFPRPVMTIPGHPKLAPFHVDMDFVPSWVDFTPGIGRHRPLGIWANGQISCAEPQTWTKRPTNETQTADVAWCKWRRKARDSWWFVVVSCMHSNGTMSIPRPRVFPGFGPAVFQVTLCGFPGFALLNVVRISLKVNPLLTNFVAWKCARLPVQLSHSTGFSSGSHWLNQIRYLVIF